MTSHNQNVMCNAMKIFFKEDFQLERWSKKKAEGLITSKNGSKGTFEEVLIAVVASPKGR